MDWGGMDFAFQGLATSVAVWALTPLDNRTYFVDPTLMFSRLLVSWRQIIPAPAGGLLLSVGAIAWSGDPDESALPGSLPDPATDPEADWIILVTYPIAPGTPLGTLFFPSLDQLHHSRARRRLGNNQGILLVAEVTLANGGAVGSAAADGTVHYRYLLKE